MYGISSWTWNVSHAGPRIGTAVFDGVEIELRGAIEPWTTLGEEATATGTARYVDSSVERIQVRVIGADRHRYVVTANGYPVPSGPQSV